MTEEKTCGNCKYFINYYFTKKGRLMSAHCGICSHKDRYRRNNIRDFDACDKWEPCNLRLQAEKDDIETAIRDMRKKLSQIEMYLRYQKDNG